jgi:hypothetical protein
MVVVFVMAELDMLRPAVVVRPTADTAPLAVTPPEAMVTFPPSPVPMVAVVAVRLLVNSDKEDNKMEVTVEAWMVDAPMLEAPTML